MFCFQFRHLVEIMGDVLHQESLNRYLRVALKKEIGMEKPLALNLGTKTPPSRSLPQPQFLLLIQSLPQPQFPLLIQSLPQLQFPVPHPHLYPHQIPAGPVGPGQGKGTGTEIVRLTVYLVILIRSQCPVLKSALPVGRYRPHAQCQHRDTIQTTEGNAGLGSSGQTPLDSAPTSNVSSIKLY